MSFRYGCLNADCLHGVIKRESEVSDHDFRLLTKQLEMLREALIADLANGKFKYIIAKGIEYRLEKVSP